jgi:hypothetical protein
MIDDLCQEQNETIMRVDDDSCKHDLQLQEMRSHLGQAHRCEAGTLPQLQRARLGCSGWKAKARQTAEEEGTLTITAARGLR